MSQQINAAMIFAAGFGTRMGELTRSTPKPMLPLAGRPMIDHAIDLVRNAGIVRQELKRWTCSIRFFVEPSR